MEASIHHSDLLYLFKAKIFFPKKQFLTSSQINAALASCSFKHQKPAIMYPNVFLLVIHPISPIIRDYTEMEMRS